MDRRLALLCASLSVVACTETAPRPDVLLVTLDTTRADHLGCYGGTWGATPGLDALASEGVRFAQVFAPTPLTLPSHASLHTGRRPPGHGVRHNGIFRLGPEAETLAEVLARAGYTTGAVVGSYVLDAEFGLARGFDDYDDDIGAGSAAAAGGFAERPAREVTERAIEWLERAPTPRFLWVHYYDPHAEYRPPAPYDARFAAHPYAGEIAAVDAELGRLLHAHRALGNEPPLLAVTADHGESLGEHGEGTHAFTLYTAALRVPWILHGPGVPGGRTVETLASLVDVAPTLLGLLGLPPLAESDGEDLSPLLAGAPERERAVYAETLATRFDYGWSELRALRTPGYHYIRAPRPELYTLETDPGELRNLLRNEDPAARALSERLDAKLRDWTRGDADAESAPLSADARRRLQSLGYLLPSSPVTETGLDPKDGLRRLAESGFAEAAAAFERGDYARAEPGLRAALPSLPESARVRGMLGRLLLATGRAGDARSHLERAAELAPGSAGYWVWAGDAAFRLGEDASALVAYERAWAGDPLDARAEAGLMLRARPGSDPAAAERHARRALELAGESDAGIRRRVAELWDRLGVYDRALELAEAALALDPDAGEAHFLAALELVRLQRLDEAEEHLERSAEHGRDTRSQNRLAVAFAVAGRPERAEAILRRLIDRHPQEPSPRLNLARVLEAQGRAP